MASKWPAKLLTGDRVLASRWLRYARLQLERLVKKGRGQLTAVSRPRPDVLVRVRRSPLQIHIHADPSRGYVYYIYHLRESAQYTTIGSPPVLIFGDPGDADTQIRRARDIFVPTKDYIQPSRLDDVYPVISHLPNMNKDFRTRVWEWDSGSIDQFYVGLHITEQPHKSNPPDDQLRLQWPWFWGDTYSQWKAACITPDAGRNWYVWYGAFDMGYTFAGHGVHSVTGAPYIRWLFHGAVDRMPDVGGTTGIGILYNDENYDGFYGFNASVVEGGYQIVYLGDNTVELIDNYYAHQTTTGKAGSSFRRSYRFISYDSGETWTNNVDFPSSYDLQEDALYIGTKLSDGTHFAIYPDSSGVVHCWTSTDGTGGWNKRAAVPGVDPQNPYPWWLYSAQLIALENNDLFFVYVRDVDDVPDPYFIVQIYAITQSGSQVTRRPDLYGSSIGLDPTDWETSRCWVNAFRPGVTDDDPITVDNATLVIVATNLERFDTDASNARDYYYNNTYDYYLCYSELGGTQPWRRGVQIAGSDGRSFDIWAYQHGTPFRKFAKLIRTVGY